MSHTLKGHLGSVISVSFSSDNTKVVSGSYEGKINIWDVKEGRILNTLIH